VRRTEPLRHRSIALAASGLGIIGLVAGCSGSEESTTSTAEPTSTAGPSTTEATTTTAAGGASSGSTAGSLPTPPSGSIEVQTSNANGIVYQRYSNSSGATPQQIVADYQAALQSEGYTVTDTGGGGGGWGKWGGSGAGLNASRSGSYVAVQAGGQTGQPVYFEVCQGSNEQATEECENQSQGPDSSSQSS